MTKLDLVPGRRGLRSGRERSFEFKSLFMVDRTPSGNPDLPRGPQPLYRTINEQIRILHPVCSISLHSLHGLVRYARQGASSCGRKKCELFNSHSKSFYRS
jgi:hypothetical protein